MSKLKNFYKKLAKSILSEPLDVAWRLYIFSLPLILWDKWQLDACEDVVLRGNGKRICWNWCRGSGKTDKNSVIAVFFMLRGYNANWFASTRKQLTRAQMCWSDNPYIYLAYGSRGFSVSDNRTIMKSLGSGVMTMSCLTSMENASGPHPHIGFWDEVALIDREIFVKSLKILNHAKDCIGVFFSTPIRESVFHDFTRMKGELTKTYLDCSWMDHQQIEEEKLPGLEWLWRQENMCEYTAAGGAVFPPITYIIEDSRQWHSFSHTQITQGVDFGGGKPHTGVRIAITGDDLYIIKEDAFKYKYDDEILQDWCDLYDTEVEIGGANEVMAPNLVDVDQEAFTNDSKYDMIGKLLQYKIHIDKALSPKTLKDMLKAIWSRTPTGKRKVDTDKLDYLAALMHAVNRCEEGDIDVQLNEYEPINPFERQFNTYM